MLLSWVESLVSFCPSLLSSFKAHQQTQEGMHKQNKSTPLISGMLPYFTRQLEHKDSQDVTVSWPLTFVLLGLQAWFLHSGSTELHCCKGMCPLQHCCTKHYVHKSQQCIGLQCSEDATNVLSLASSCEHLYAHHHSSCVSASGPHRKVQHMAVLPVLKNSQDRMFWHCFTCSCLPSVLHMQKASSSCTGWWCNIFWASCRQRFGNHPAGFQLGVVQAWILQGQCTCHQLVSLTGITLAHNTWLSNTAPSKLFWSRTIVSVVTARSVHRCTCLFIRGNCTSALYTVTLHMRCCCSFFIHIS